MSNVLTIVFDKAEQKIDSVVAAAVNELHNLGHTVKEVRVMGDSGEAKVALNQVEGIVATAADTAVADAKSDVAAVTEPADVVTNKNPDGSSPVSPITPAAVPDVPVDGVPEQTKEEETSTTEATTADPTQAPAAS